MINYLYNVYGLSVGSELELPELIPVQDSNVDVTIASRKVPEHLPEVRGTGILFEAGSNDFLFKFEGIGRFRVQNGSRLSKLVILSPSNTKDYSYLEIL